MKDYPEAFVNLIDALRDYVEIERALFQDACNGKFGDIPKEKLDEARAEINAWAKQLADMEKHDLQIWRRNKKT